MLLINLVQNNDVNTQRLLNVRIRVDNEHDIISRSISALDLIVDLFFKREELARYFTSYFLHYKIIIVFARRRKKTDFNYSDKILSWTKKIFK